MAIPSPQTKPPDPFTLFVRAKPGRIVRRFGTQTHFGYTFVPGTKDKTSEQVWDGESITALTADEVAAYSKEYEAELAEDGGLVPVKREEWEKQRADRKALRKKTGELLEKAAEQYAAKLLEDHPGRELKSLTHAELFAWFNTNMPGLLPVAIAGEEPPAPAATAGRGK